MAPGTRGAVAGVALLVAALLAAGTADRIPEEARVARRANRLALQKSPYLLQHAHNPVDWYPWGDEAFERARREDRPVFLSIGYSTCHWCHVMERESFEDEETARLMNEGFVCVKVDREERPDVDAVYMAAVQATGQGGGWPLSAFLAPDRRPFFLGTYFPPEDRYGRPGFRTVLAKMREAWAGRRDDALGAGEELARAVAAASATLPAEGLGPATLDLGVRQFAARFDSARGGFGDAPKFPRGHSLSFLLREAARTGSAEARTMALGTLRAMARGGMYDQVGGGFHRYSTDGDWLVPHFEKMLYDQATLAEAATAAYLLSGDHGFGRTGRETLEYVLRDLRHPDGGFLTAEDADSEGIEGKFYLWTEADLRAALGPDDAALVGKVYGAGPRGNFRGEAEEAPPGANILHLPRPLEDLAGETGLAAAALRLRLDAARPKLLAARAKRVRPHLDDKVLAGWNGMMISAFAKGARAFREERYAEAAGRAADFVLGRMRRDGRLLRRWRDGEAAVPACVEDVAFLGLGLLDLYEATGDARRLREAASLADGLRRFADPATGAFWFTADDAEGLIARTREGEDWAVPSGNSAAALLLLRLGRMTGEPALEEAGRGVLRAFSGGVARLPMAYPAMLAALDFDLGPTREVVLAGDPASKGFRALRAEIDRRFLPRVTVLVHPQGAAGREIEALAPWLKGYGPVDGRPAAYVCTALACQAPVTDPAALAALLE